MRALSSGPFCAVEAGRVTGRFAIAWTPTADSRQPTADEDKDGITVRYCDR